MYSDKHNLHRLLSIPKQHLFNFANTMQKNYKSDNSYHNAMHGCDVTFSMYHTIRLPNKKTRVEFSTVEIFAAIIAAVVHDYEHLGVTNNFLINTRHPLAVLYNDRSVLENHHCAQGFRALLHPRLNFVESLNPQDFNVFRSIAIQLVLATDMSRHGEYMKLTADPLWPSGALLPHHIGLHTLVLSSYCCISIL